MAYLLFYISVLFKILLIIFDFKVYLFVNTFQFSKLFNVFTYKT